MTGALPNLLVIGASKCGTSALHYYLDLHPEVRMSSPKELNFFVGEDDFDPEPFISDRRELALFGKSRNWSRGLDWYAGHFQAQGAVRGESSPSYSAPWHPRAAERIASVIPDVRLIYMVRDPIERLVSHYMDRRVQAGEWRSVGEATSRPGNMYLARSRYMESLRPFLEQFPRERMRILRQDDLLHRRRATMREVFGFLGVDDSYWSPKMERLRNRSEAKGRRYRIAERFRLRRATAPLYRLRPEGKWWVERLASAASRGGAKRPTVSVDVRRRLLEALEPDIAELERLMGWDLSPWRRAGP